MEWQRGVCCNMAQIKVKSVKIGQTQLKEAYLLQTQFASVRMARRASIQVCFLFMKNIFSSYPGVRTCFYSSHIAHLFQTVSTNYTCDCTNTAYVGPKCNDVPPPTCSKDVSPGSQLTGLTSIPIGTIVCTNATNAQQYV